MLSLAALRYRNVLAADGGPVTELVTGSFSMCGRSVFQANARLKAGLIPTQRHSVYSDAAGTGAHPVASIARHMAISESMERWAFHATVRSERAEEFAFDIDPSTNGMAAYPGLFTSQSRRRAVLEAVERFCLLHWWEGRLEGRVIDTDWPGVSAVIIDGPFGGVTAIAYMRTDWGGYAYGHAAAESLGGAVERAMFELSRHELVVRRWRIAHDAGAAFAPTGLFERRSLFFASEEGHVLFSRRISRRINGSPATPHVVCDREIDGPWSEYATVWRFAVRPPSEDYLRRGEDYFFW